MDRVGKFVGGVHVVAAIDEGDKADGVGIGVIEGDESDCDFALGDGSDFGEREAGDFFDLCQGIISGLKHAGDEGLNLRVGDHAAEISQLERSDQEWDAGDLEKSESLAWQQLSGVKMGGLRDGGG